MRLRGFTLWELVAVVTLLGILAAAGMARFGGATTKMVGARAEARRLALDLHQARRRAISTGENHYLSFTPSGGPVTSYTLLRRTSGGDVTVEATREVSAGVVIMPSSGEAEFTFEGTALAAYTITVAGGEQTWTITVIPSTGAVQVTEPS